MSAFVSRFVSSRRLVCCGVAVLALVACARSPRAPGPAHEPPADVEGEAVRGPSPDAVVTDVTHGAAPEGHAKLDWNADGHVDREEFRNYFARVFHAADGDDDRVLRGPELAAVPADAMQAADHDGNGGLDVAEYVELAFVWFVRCDRNADDVLGPDETAACAESAASAQK